MFEPWVRQEVLHWQTAAEGAGWLLPVHLAREQTRVDHAPLHWRRRDLDGRGMTWS